MLSCPIFHYTKGPKQPLIVVKVGLIIVDVARQRSLSAHGPKVPSISLNSVAYHRQWLRFHMRKTFPDGI